MFHLQRNSVFLKNLLNTSKYYSNVNNEFYDIIIGGGGMVGTTLASALGKNTKLSDKKILLLEGSKEFKWKPTPKYSNRVSALSPGTRELMESIGAWKHITDIRHCPVKKMQVWDSLSDAMISFNKDDKFDTIAYIVENDLLLHSVTKVINEFKNVKILHEAKIKDYKLPKLHEDTAEVLMENGKVYKCNLLLGCDGANSKVRQSMGVQYVAWSYDQMGVVATLKFSEKSDNIVAWQRFIPTGPIALLPLNEDHSSLVWTTTPEHAKKLLNMSVQEFVDELNSSLTKVYPRSLLVDSAVRTCNSILQSMNLPSNASRQFPPKIVDIGEKSRAAFPLGFGHATNYVSKGVALVGDAAHRVHPMAGQGVNLGFGDVQCLNDLLSNAVYSGNNLGSLVHLKEYESARQRHNVPIMVGIDGLQKLYGTDMSPVVFLRSLGLQITNALNPLKNLVTSYASR